MRCGGYKIAAAAAASGMLAQELSSRLAQKHTHEVLKNRNGGHGWMNSNFFRVTLGTEKEMFPLRKTCQQANKHSQVRYIKWYTVK